VTGAFTYDVAYTSVLKRAIKTLWIILETMDLEWIPVVRAWQLNERHYGALQGSIRVKWRPNTAKNRCRSGAGVTGWRPPALDPDDPRHPGSTGAMRTWHPNVIPGLRMPGRHRGSHAALLAQRHRPAILAGQRVWWWPTATASGPGKAFGWALR